MRRIWRNSGQTIECVPCDLTGANRMGLVGDGIQYVDTRNKSAGYDVVAGTMGTGIVISKGEVERMHTEKRVSGRWYSKKKQWGD